MKSCNNCPLFCCFKQRQYPSFDYDEIDDLEFENLLNEGGTGGFGQQQEPSIWNSIASLFRFSPNGYSRTTYQPLPTFDTTREDVLFGQESQATAQLLTNEQVSKLTSFPIPTPSSLQISLIPPSPVKQEPPNTAIMSAIDESEFFSTKVSPKNTKGKSKISDPLNVKQLGQSLSSTGDIIPEVKEVPEIEVEEVFDPKLLETLSKANTSFK